MELGCQLIQKSVIERALQKVDQDNAIINEIENRRTASQHAREYRDESNAHYFERLPALLKPSPAGLTQQQFMVYEDFSRLTESPVEGSGS